MIERTNHIISRCHWDTSFDDKDSVSQLQDEISQWTTNRLHIEAYDVFEKLCPKDQVWKIDQLNLDLGIIYYEDLGSSLSREFSKQINEKLIDLILNSNTTNKVEIDTLENAQLSVLEHYLIHGFIEWNHEIDDITIQDILSYQIKHNSEKLKRTLNLIGKNEQSRQRLAWQTSEQDLKSILKLLEPYKHELIKGYLDILIDIQSDVFKSTMTRNSFKRHLWFWTFNYIFSNNHSLFNSANFIKSMIALFANHFDSEISIILNTINNTCVLKKYQKTSIITDFIKDIKSLIEAKDNIKTLELFNTNIKELENSSVEKLEQNLINHNKLDQDNWIVFQNILLNPVFEIIKSNKDNFNTLILKLYAKDPERFKKIIEENNKSDQVWSEILNLLNNASDDLLENALINYEILEPDNWAALRNVLLNPLSKLQKLGKNDINELVTKLYSSDPKRFKQIIWDTDKSPQVWNDILKQLDNNAISVVFKAVSPSYHKQIIDTIYFLNSVNSFQDDVLNKQQLYSISIQFLLSKKEANHNHIDVLKYCLEEIATKSKTNNRYLIESLIHANETNFINGIEEIDFRRDFDQFIISELLITPKSYDNLVSKLLKNLLSKNIDNNLKGITEKWLTSYEILVKMVAMQPLKAFDVFSSYRLKNRFTQNQFVKLLDVHSISLMIQTVNPELYQIILKFNKLLDSIENEKLEISSRLSQTLFNEIVYECFDRLLNNPSFSTNNTEELIDSVLSSYYKYDYKTFHDFFTEFFEHSEIHKLKISKAFIHDKQKEILKAKQDYKSLLSLKTIVIKKDCLLISKILQSLSLHDEISYYKLFSDSNLDAFFPNAEAYVAKSVKLILDKKVTKFLKEESNNLGEKLKTTFLKILLDYKSHLGDKQKIIEEFNNIAAYHIDVLKKSKSRNKRNQDKNQTYFNGNESFVIDGEKLKANEIFDSIQLAFQTPRTQLKSEAQKNKFSALLKMGLLISPDTIRNVLRTGQLKESKIATLSDTLTFEEFVASMSQNLYGEPKDILLSLNTLYRMIAKLSPDFMKTSLESEIWTLAILSLTHQAHPIKNLEILTGTILQKLSQDYEIESNDVIKVLEEEELPMSPILKESFVKQSPYFKILNAYNLQNRPTTEMVYSYENNCIEELCYTIFTQNKIPNWYDNPHNLSPKQLLKDVVEFYPLILLKVLTFKKQTATQLIQLNQMIGLSELVKIISKLNLSKRQSLKHAITFYEILDSINIKKQFPYELQHAFLNIILNAWTTANWKLIEPESILNQVMWSLCKNSKRAKKDIIIELQSKRMQLPATFQLALNLISDEGKLSVEDVRIEERVLHKLLRKHTEVPTKIEHGIKINNAGLVLINNYLPHLFEHLGLTENDEFLTIDKQLDAVHFLQYVATGASQTEESYLTLNKILCGFHPTEPVLDGIDISDSQVKLISEMIKAIIGHWPTIGSSSVEGFMGNWLIRDGMLLEEDDRWKLKIEKKAYDILINTSPFSFSIINHKWMNKPLYVEWQY
ncbi:contractile injection system tape measure protein [Psychroserpens sp.]|uniref:contractile injection system tape measure protein n=1 Tax=Psychroserpens sp. TaxID=2020870 RepID=UPI002B271DD5|nr:contractile injection system tape measure protein [Psychroserpens sp.]